jgi:MYXO-CTERM domain-containing protein
VTVDTRPLDDKLAQADIEVNIAPLCDPDGEPDLYFLPVDRIGTSEAVAPYGYFQVPVDVDPPAAPSGVKGGRGETEIPVSWDRGSGNPINYWLVWDPEPTEGGAAGSGDTDGGVEAGSGAAGASGSSGSGGTSGSDTDDTSDNGGSTAECGSTKLVPGMPFDVGALPPGIKRKRVEGDVTSATLSGSEVGGDRAAVSVIAEDLAGNHSVLSDFGCVRVVPTVGFWDEYKDGGGAAEAGCACSVPSASRSPLSALPVVLALLLLRVRRKRRS